MKLHLDLDRPVVRLPTMHRAYADARVVLRAPYYHDAADVALAFDVLSYSPDASDRELCRHIADQMAEDDVSNAGGVIVWLLISFIAASVLGLWAADQIVGIAAAQVEAGE